MTKFNASRVVAKVGPTIAPSSKHPKVLRDQRCSQFMNPAA